jgi:hypothetical protein
MKTDRLRYSDLLQPEVIVLLNRTLEYVQTRSVPKQHNHSALRRWQLTNQLSSFTTLKEPWLVSELLLCRISMFQATISTSLPKTVRWVVI